jgi:glutamine synthetase
LKILPWDRRFAWMSADMSFGGREPYALCPRSALKRQVTAAADMGFVAQLGIEPEFYVFKPESVRPGSTQLVPMALSGEIKPSPAYDVESALDAMPFLDRMCQYMSELGFGLFSFDAEGGEGQYEFDFAHAPVLEAADRMTLFRLMTRQAAKECGLLATFMPKPFENLWGSGAHHNVSLEDLTTGENLFRSLLVRRGGFAARQGSRGAVQPHDQLVPAPDPPPRRRQHLLGTHQDQLGLQQQIMHASAAGEPTSDRKP